MSERIHALAYRLLGKPSIDECGLQEIRTLAERYPYFAPAQFLLLEKLKRTGSDEYAAQSQKAVLYYHNPIEFEQFISSDRFYTELQLEDSSFQPPAPYTLDTFADIPAEEAIEETEEEKEELPSAEETVSEEPVHEIEEEVIPQATEPEVLNEDMAIAEDIIHPEAAAVENEPPSMKALPAEEEAAAPAESPVTEPPSTNTPSASLPSTLPPSTDTPSPDALTFEPFHTVDYFASQGIKLSQEEAGSGAFGKQLKSFTEWLKTMKRLPPPELSARLDRSSEKTVQNLAEGSVHDADIVTEAMAEVWIKQGKTEKALEVYNKLSLLNPSKKAYFAAKIDKLKR